MPTMTIRITCPCGKQLQARDDYAGKRVKCPTCGKTLAVPGGGDGAAAEALTTKPDPAKKAAAIHFACACGRQLQARPELAGRRTKCPDCGEALIIPHAFAPP